jgi:diguanylate cyclase (GGDEF)-like protein
VRNLGTILVVEDHRTTRDGLTQLLEEEGYEVAATEDGLAGKRYLIESNADLVICDVAMPGMDGFDLVKWMRGIPTLVDLPVILWSGHAEIDSRVTGLDAGADDYLCKPVDPDELLAKVRAHMRRATRSRDLHVAAIIDPLTGVRNRRGIDQALEAELARSRRTGQSLSVFMIDLDGFKQINDRRGHAAGDAVLKRVASGLKQAVRPYDTVGRFGGDEFLIIASGLSSTRAFVEARLRDAAPGIAMSIGAATAGPRESLDALIGRADANMYVEKKSRSVALGVARH